MRHEYSAGGVVVKKEKNKAYVLIAQHSQHHGWVFPKGLIADHIKEEKKEKTAIREVKEETGLDVMVVRKVGEYHEQGVQAGVEYDYYPACFLVKVVGGEIEKQQSEIEDIQLFSFDDIPKPLAFVHNQMVNDYLASREAQFEK